MKHHFPTTLLSRFLPVVLGLIAAAAFGAPKKIGNQQPHMHKAADELHEAKMSQQPLEDLQAAKRELKMGSHNKGGYRAAAIPVVDRAIAQIKAGDRRAANKTIDEAIALVTKGANAGR